MQHDIGLCYILRIDCLAFFKASHPLLRNWRVDYAIDNTVRYMDAFWSILTSKRLCNCASSKSEVPDQYCDFAYKGWTDFAGAKAAKPADPFKLAVAPVKIRVPFPCLLISRRAA